MRNLHDAERDHLSPYAGINMKKQNRFITVDSLVSIVTSLQAGRPGFDFCHGKIFLLAAT